MPQFFVTYEIVTPESAEHGDADSRGYATPRGGRHDTNDGAGLTLREAIGMVGCVEDSGSWFTEIDGSPDYKTGAHETLSLHPPRNITGASYGRVKRLLGAR